MRWTFSRFSFVPFSFIFFFLGFGQGIFKDFLLQKLVIGSNYVWPFPAADTGCFVSKPWNSTSKGSHMDQMVFVSGGSYQMGDVMNDQEEADEMVHTVLLSDYYLGAYEVTFESYDFFCEVTGRKKTSDQGWGRGQNPVIGVTWYDALEYCNWLSKKEGRREVYFLEGKKVKVNWDADGYRLPTEAEWEFAARERGKPLRFGNGKNIADPAEINFNGKWKTESYSKPGVYRKRTMAVGSFAPNELGLYDMSGNVAEWCWDFYAPDYGNYQESRDPRGPEVGATRVVKGGSWFSAPSSIRVSNRVYAPNARFYHTGFRLARSAHE